MLEVEKLVTRYKFFLKEGTPFALPPISQEAEYHKYEIMAEFEVVGEIGGGKQYTTRIKIGNLERLGFMEDIKWNH